MSQGDEYRNALEASQRRVEMLERELQRERADVPLRPVGTPTWVALLATFGGLGLGGIVLGVGALIVSNLSFHSRVDETPPAEPPTHVTPQRVRIGATWYTGLTQGPRVQVDVNGDGDKDVVGLFWRGPVDEGLFVAAMDRKTFEPIWTAGPYPSQWSGPHTHLAITDDYVLVTDSRETLHVLDAKTGASVHDLAFMGGATSACQLAATPSLFRLDRGYRNHVVLDPAAGTLQKETRDAKLVCANERPECKHALANEACWVVEPNAAARAKVPGFSAYLSERLGDSLFTDGFVAGEPGTRGLEWLLVSDAKGKKRWTSAAVAEGDTLHIAGHVKSEATNRAVVTFYQRSAGDFRLLARATGTGALLWTQSIAGTKEGSFAELFVEDDELFVFADHVMHVYDLDTGSERRVSHGI